MKWIPRPTLTRRVLAALFIAFAGVWVVLLTFRYIEVRSDENANPALRAAGSQLADILSTVDDTADAHTIVAAIDRATRRARRRLGIPGDVLIQLWDVNRHQLAFTSPSTVNLNMPQLPGQQVREVVNGETYETVRFDTSRWRVLVAQSRIESGWLLRYLSTDLARYMLVAFPFLLLPMWLAVSRGLRPLRHLSERIAARNSQDLAPIDIDSKYAELSPLVSALNRLLSQLHQKISREQAFVANAAHELRTPLAVISAQATVLAKAATDSQRGEAERRMDSAIARASHLAHQLLVLARLDMADPGAPTSVDLAQLAREAIGNLVPGALARNVEVSLEAPEKLEACVDALAFQTVLQNLIDNAVRYGRRDGHVIVELELVSLPPASVMLSVSDDGPGIAEVERPRVFERFYRGQNVESTGAGLGLSIVKQATARMGGSIQLVTGPGGHGCRFEVWIPRVQTRMAGNPSFAICE